MKRTIAFLLVMAMLFALAACSGGNSSGTNPSANGENLPNGEESTENNENVIWVVPEGCIYIAADETTYGPGEELPEGYTPRTGDILITDDYEYCYNQKYSGSYWTDLNSRDPRDGWYVAVKDKSKTSYGELLDEIFGMPLIGLYNTFGNCDNMIEAPEIPSTVITLECAFHFCDALISAPEIPVSVTSMRNTFSYCPALTTAPTIPESVDTLYQTFLGCSSLTGIIAINANPDEYDTCFWGVDFEGQGLTLTGDSYMLELLMETAEE